MFSCTELAKKYICVLPYHHTEKIELFGQPNGSEGKESAYDARDMAVVPGSGRSPGGENGNRFQYSRLENGQRSLVGYCLGYAQSRTWLGN